MDHTDPRQLASMARGYLTAAAHPSGTRMHTIPPHDTICEHEVRPDTWQIALDSCTEFASNHHAYLVWLPARLLGYHLWRSQNDPEGDEGGFLLLRHSLVTTEPAPGHHVQFHTVQETSTWWIYNQAMERLHRHARALPRSPLGDREHAPALVG